MINPEQIGSRIGALIKGRGGGVYLYAAEHYLDKSTVYYWIRGERLPTLSNLVDLADAFGVSIDWILRGGPADGDKTTE